MRPQALALALCFVLASASSAHAQDRNRVLELNASVLDGDYVPLSDKFGLAGPSAITVEAWVHPTSYAGFPTIVGNDFLGSYWFGLNTSGNPRFYPTGGSSFDAPIVVPLNEWTHLAATYDGTTARIFRNGVQVATSSAFSGPIGSTAGDLRIGADRNAGTPAFFWRGYLDEVRIWNVARTGAQILETLYTGGAQAAVHTPPYAGLRSYWDFETPDPPAARDAYSSGRSGTLLGTASYTYSPAAPLSYNIAVQFDGLSDYWDGFPISGFESGLTLMAWIAPNSTTGGHRAIVAKDYTTSFYLGLNPAGRLRFYPKGGIGQYVESDGVIPGGRWTHVAVTYSDGMATIYVNGQLDHAWPTSPGLVGENAATVRIGADHEAGEPAYFFGGLIDEVKIIAGELARPEILRQMSLGGRGGLSSFTDTNGRTVIGRTYALDRRTDGSLEGLSGRFVRSGAPLWNVESPLYGVVSPRTYNTRIGAPLTLPDDDASISVGSSMVIPDPGTVTDLDCFVVMPSTRNDLLRVTLRSPLGTEIQLVTVGEARGRDLATTFDDEASLALSAAEPPYVTGVRPSQPLSTFDGEPRNGEWRLILQTTLVGASYPGRVGLWAWGIRHGPTTNVGADRPAIAGLSLRRVGANPVRGSGAFSFELPRAARAELALYDTQGRRVRTLLEGAQPAGATHLGWSTDGLAPGAYFARLRADGFGEHAVPVTIVR